LTTSTSDNVMFLLRDWSRIGEIRLSLHVHQGAQGDSAGQNCY